MRAPNHAFNKRLYTVCGFLVATRDIFGHLDDLLAARQRGSISRAFAEKIMLSVTQVNDCRYCRYGHLHMALQAGVSEPEIQHLLIGDLGTFPKEESIALAFAQHYAEQGDHPEPAAWDRLVDYYGLETAGDILAYIRMITFGNLSGNTFDALLNRLKGKPAQNSSLASELGVLLLGVILVPLGAVAWGANRALSRFVFHRAAFEN
jgi:AhpD family alkylhydroperoxidase